MSDEKARSWEAEYDHIQRLLAQSFLPLRFHAPHEAAFRARMRQQAHLTLKNYFWLLFLLFPASYLCIFYDRFEVWHWVGEPQDFITSLTVGAWALVGVLLISLCGRLAIFRDRYLAFMVPLAGGILVVMAVGAMSLTDQVMQQRSTYPIVYIMMIIYGISGMRVVEAATIGFGSMLVAMAVLYLGSWPELDWSLFLLFFSLANFVGLVNGYVVETKERRLYLQESLLRLEKQQLNELSERLVQLAREDGLTQLANRRHFSDTFLMEWERARRERQSLALVFIDIDHFKAYNDTYGHLAGDHALQQVASVIQAAVRRAGDLAARYGGEEFVLLLPNTPMTGAMELADELLHQVDALQLPHKASSVSNHVTISVGVCAVVPDMHLAPSQLIDAADEALYQAKHGGRHRVVASPGL